MDEIDYWLVEYGLAFFFLLFLTFLSFFESALHNLTSFDLKLLNEQQREKKSSILHHLAYGRLQVIIPLNFGIQLSFIALAILTTHLVLLRITAYPVVWAFAIVFLINLIFRQLIPRMIMHHRAEQKVLLLLPLFSYIYPVLRVLASPVLATVRSLESAEAEPEEVKSKDTVQSEIKALIDIGKEEEVLEKDEGRLVRSVLEFGDARAKQVMTPRQKIVAAPEGATVTEVIDLMVTEKHSRIPIYRDSLDTVIGVVYVRHLLKKLKENPEDERISDLLLTPIFVSGGMLLSALLKEIKTRRSAMVFVRDENGGIAGLITIEDLLEEIVGEIYDEDQTEEEDVIPQGNNAFFVSGNVELSRLGKLLEASLRDDDCQTIGGLITKTIGRLPKKNERILLAGLEVTVLHVDEKKVNRLLVKKATQVIGDLSAPGERIS